MNLDVNGKAHTIEADPDMPLLYALRNDLARAQRMSERAADTARSYTSQRVAGHVVAFCERLRAMER